MKNRNLTLIF